MPTPTLALDRGGPVACLSGPVVYGGAYGLSSFPGLDFSRFMNESLVMPPVSWFRIMARPGPVALDLAVPGFLVP